MKIKKKKNIASRPKWLARDIFDFMLHIGFCPRYRGLRYLCFHWGHIYAHFPSKKYTPISFLVFGFSIYILSMVLDLLWRTHPYVIFCFLQLVFVV
jgi:hypothetical protein